MLFLFIRAKILVWLLGNDKKRLKSYLFKTDWNHETC